MRTRFDSSSGEKRHRNVAHLWADKRVLRFFRHMFKKRDGKNLLTVYIALCEMDSDFGEGRQIKSFTKTVASYARSDRDTTRRALMTLRKLGLIDYGQGKNQAGRFCSSSLQMYKWDQPSEKVIEQARRRLENPSPDGQPSRRQENPETGKPGDGKTRSYKNDKSSNGKNDESSKCQETTPTQAVEGEVPFDPEANIQSIAVRLTKKFCDTYVKPILHIPKISNDRFWSSVRSIRKLLEDDGLDARRISHVIDWLVKNYDQPFVTEVASAHEFQLKFTALEKAMTRKHYGPGGNGSRPSNAQRDMAEAEYGKKPPSRSAKTAFTQTIIQ